MRVLVHEQLLPVSSWDDSSTPLALHCTRLLINMVPILQQLYSIFHLPLRLHLFEPFTILRGQPKIARMALVASPFHTPPMLLGAKLSLCFIEGLLA